MTASFETLQVEAVDAIRVVRIHRPDVLNALNEQVLDELSECFAAVADDVSVRGVILSGGGERAFVAGADIAAMVDMSEAEATVFASRGHAVADAIAHLPVPVMAAVQGFALGGGCELALACDFIYASDRAKFGQPEVNLGVVPGFGGTQRLMRAVGKAMALELTLTGRIFGAEEALRLGLVNAVVAADELMEHSLATMQKIAEKGPLAVAAAKRLMHEGADLPLAAANQREISEFSGLFSSHDQSEGMRAFLDKRPAQFRDRGAGPRD